MSLPPDFPYRRLPGALRGFIRKASLWEGPDHLLSIDGNRFVERYRRFYYRDIEAIIVQKSPRAGSLVLWVLSGLALFLAWNWLTHRRWIMASLPAVIGLFLLLLYRVIVSLRFSCRCFIQTAVSREQIPALLRARNLEPALSRIRCRIAEAQGTLPDEITAEQQQYLALIAQAPPTPDLDRPIHVPLPQSVSSAPVSFAVYLALVGFLVCLINAAATYSFMDAPSPVLNTIGMRIFTVLLTFAQGGTFALALLRMHKLRALRSLRNFVLAGLCFTGLEISVTPLLSRLFSVQNGASTIRMDALVIWQSIQKVDFTLALLLGTGGLILILLNWQTFRRGGFTTT
jgi:hypothetical protein